MFDKLVDFIITQINKIIPVYFIYEYQLGLRFWCGRVKKDLTPGIWFKFPYLHTMMRENCVDTTTVLPTQSIITKDGIEIVIQLALGYKIVGIRDYFCNVYDTKSALCDRAMVITREVISSCTFKQVKKLETFDVVLTLLRNAVENYGIDVQFVKPISLTNSISLRLFNETTPIDTTQ